MVSGVGGLLNVSCFMQRCLAVSSAGVSAQQSQQQYTTQKVCWLNPQNAASGPTGPGANTKRIGEKAPCATRIGMQPLMSHPEGTLTQTTM